MSTGHVILGVLMFAVVTAILYAWGLGKSMDQKTDLVVGNIVDSLTRRPSAFPAPSVFPI